MKLLIAGSNGFLGKWVMGQLDDGNGNTIGVDLPRWDLTQIGEAKNAFKSVQPDSVVHLAARAGASGKGGSFESKKNPWDFLNNNIRVTLNLLEACRLFDVNRLVLISSFSVYGNNPECPISELTRLNPDNAYGLSKCAGEDLVRFYSAEYGIKSVILRPTLICGEGQKEMNALREFVIDAIEGRPLQVWCGGNHRREWLHPADVARAIEKALAYAPSVKTVDTFVLGSVPISMKKLAAVVGIHIAGTRVKDIEGSRCFDQVTNHDKIERTLNWEPEVSAEEIVRRVVWDIKHKMEPS